MDMEQRKWERRSIGTEPREHTHCESAWKQSGFRTDLQSY